MVERVLVEKLVELDFVFVIMLLLTINMGEMLVSFCFFRLRVR